MCGILGIVNYNPGRIESARKALDTLTHRGPDQHGEWSNDHIYLGHRRLSILDLSGNGRQPLTDSTEEIVIVVNGEIYNYFELKSLLDHKYYFKSKCDSELFVHGYREWGIDGFLEKIDGMFAFIIYDKRTDSIYFGRDRYGKKPIFYSRENNEIIIASEIKAIFEYFPSKRVFSTNGIAEWILFRGSRSGKTIYHDIFRLQPGHYVKIQHIGEEKVCYYNLLDHIDEKVSHKSLDEYLEELDYLLKQAVQKRLLSDVPVGLQLSGGVDSSLIARYLRYSHTGEINTYCIGFNNEHSEYSEEKYARYIADSLGLTHHQINIGQKEIISSFDDTLYFFDGMLDIPNGIAIYLLSKRCKEKITVALTGEGADELFCGYSKNITIQKLINQHSFQTPDFLGSILNQFNSSKINSIYRKLYLNKKYGGNLNRILETSNSYVSPETVLKLFSTDNFYLLSNYDKKRILEFSPVRAVQLVDHYTYLTFLLDRQDRASMGAAIESRLPFLDRNLVEWGMNLPEALLFNKRETKIILKNLSEKYFGKEFTYREKMGFPLPINKWINEQIGFKPYVDRIFDGNFILKDNIQMDTLFELFTKNSFNNKLICYGDSEVMWLKWFLLVLRQTQDIFRITDIK
jgi:asparagine synthase (glutamine-hydrolysing)